MFEVTLMASSALRASLKRALVTSALRLALVILYQKFTLKKRNLKNSKLTVTYSLRSEHVRACYTLVDKFIGKIGKFKRFVDFKERSYGTTLLQYYTDKKTLLER